MLLHPETSFPEKEREAMQWPVARSSPPLMPINTGPSESGADDGEDDEEFPTAVTPTAKEARIPEQLPCPLAPRKRGPLVRCQLSGVEFFCCPPDLETVFMRHPQKAK